MSCCIGLSLRDRSEKVPWEEEAYVLAQPPRPLSPPSAGVPHRNPALPSNLDAPESHSCSCDAMSSTAAVPMRVPQLPTTSRGIRGGLKTNKQTSTFNNSTESSPRLCTNNEYYFKKFGDSGSSGMSRAESSDAASGSFHCKASSSDSTSSRDDVSELRTKDLAHKIPATTCYEYEAANPDEISFKRGSKVFVRSKPRSDEHYVYIEVNGKFGLAPKTFLQAIGNTPAILDENAVEKQEPAIGEGSFSKVYIATYNGMRCALKEYKEQSFEKALREGESLNIMNHVNIVKVIGVLRSPVALLIEFCEGDQLVNVLQRSHFNPPIRIIMNWALQIAEGIWHMHNRELPVCHSDIKPQNIMIKEIPCKCDLPYYRHEDADMCSTCGYRRLSRLTLKLTDFGLARPSSSKLEASNFGGSAPYMAPEYIREMQASPKADVWSFGVLMWEMLTKETPYKEEFEVLHRNALILMLGIAKRELQLDIPFNAPLPVKILVKDCWNEDPNLRPSMGEIISRIKRMPLEDPEYVAISDKPSSKSEIRPGILDKLKKLLVDHGIHNEVAIKPTAPKRKMNKEDIGKPLDFKHEISIHKDENGVYTVQDFDEERRRHKSSHDGSNGTLPRSGLLSAAYSTPNLDTVIDALDPGASKTLERANAVRRKSRTRGSDQPFVTTCLPSLDDNTPTTLGSMTSIRDAFAITDVDSDAVQIIDEKDLHRQKNSHDSPRDANFRAPAKRSSSSNSQSTFYVSANGDTITTPNFDTATIRSDSSSVELSSSKKSKREKFLRHFFPSKSKERKDFGPVGNYENAPIFDLSPSAQMQKIPLHPPVGVPSTSAVHFTKHQDSALKERARRVAEHRRNPSNTSEIVINKDTPRRPSFRQSTTDSSNSLTPGTPSHAYQSHSSGHSPSSSGMISLEEVLPFPDHNHLPEPSPYMRLRSSSTDVRLFTDTELPLPTPAPAPVAHGRSRSSDAHAVMRVDATNSAMLDSLVRRMVDQKLVENTSYFKLQNGPGSRASSTTAISSIANSDDDHVPHYHTIKQTRPIPNAVPVIPPRINRRNADEPPPRPPPRSSISHLNTVIELPSNNAAPLEARSHLAVSSSQSSVYLTPDTGCSPHSSISGSPVNSPSHDLPQSIAPMLPNRVSPGAAPVVPNSITPRPDSLNLTLRRDQRYVRLAGQMREGAVPNIPTILSSKKH